MGLFEPTVTREKTAPRATSEVDSSVVKMNGFSKSRYCKMGLFLSSCLHFSTAFKNSGKWITCVYLSLNILNIACDIALILFVFSLRPSDISSCPRKLTCFFRLSQMDFEVLNRSITSLVFLYVLL